MSDTLGTNAGQEPLEELVGAQALSLDLREAVMACLSGPAAGLFWNWSSGFKNLGIRASRASVTAALAEVGLELESSRAGRRGASSNEGPNGFSSPNQSS